MTLVTIDPGLEGAVSIARPLANIETRDLMLEALRDVIAPKRYVVIERVGGSGNNKLQRSFGTCLGWALGHGCPTFVVPPSVWQLPLDIQAPTYALRKRRIHEAAMAYEPDISRSQADAYMMMRWVLSIDFERLDKYEYKS